MHPLTTYYQSSNHYIPILISPPTPMPYHGCTPALLITNPASASLFPSTTSLIKMPPKLGSPAPNFFSVSAPTPANPVAKNPGLIANTLTPSSFNNRTQSNIIIFNAVLELRYAIAVHSGGLGQPAGTVAAWAAEILPEEQLVREERPEVTKSRRGVLEARRSGMKVEVKTWVLVTFTEYEWSQASRRPAGPGLSRAAES